MNMQINFSTYLHNKNNINFGTREDVRRKSDKFACEIIKKSRSGELEKEKLEEITRKYIPEIEIEILPIKTKRYKDIAGMYHSTIVFEPDPKEANFVKSELILKNPKDKRLNFEEYLLTIIHEMTHAFQAKDDECRDDKLFTRSLQHLPIEKWKRQADVGYDTFARLEADLLKPEIFAHRELISANDGEYPYNTSTNTEKMTKAINTKLDKVAQENPDIDIPFLKQLFYALAMDEADAYTTEEKTRKRLNPKIEMDNFIANLYLGFAKCLQEPKAEKK